MAIIEILNVIMNKDLLSLIVNLFWVGWPMLRVVPIGLF